MIKFSPRVKLIVLGNQSRKRGESSLCAWCGEYINSNPFFEGKDVEGGWYAVPRNPQGRKTIENCEIICSKCYRKLVKNSTEMLER